MAAKIFRINYKSDFILTLTSDAGWMTPFCIKFWTGSPMLAYYASWDGETYAHCAPVAGDPTKLLVQFDDHHLPIGDLKFQIAYHFTVADFPNDTEDEVLNQASITTEVDGETYQVMLDFTGETAPEIQFSLPAYANEAQRIANEQQRIANEEQRIAAETVRIQNEQQRITQEQIRQQNEQQRINQEQARVEEYANLKADAVAATGAANDAAALANQKAQLAADKAALAQSAANLANAKAQLAADKAALADAAATLANQKAALAQQKAEYAQEQGTYSKNQGDYAKEQGDYSKAKGDYAKDQGDYSKSKGDYAKDQGDYSKQQGDYAKEQGNICAADHLVAVEDHQTAAADHQTATTDHQTATADHNQAGNDHTRAESDHTRAESDHAAVEVYVDSLGAFDISAYHATGGVLAEYADLIAALGTNGSNIPEALRKGGMSVKFVLSSDNNSSQYVQYRYMSTSTAVADFTNVANWQGIDDEPTAGSDNLVKSGGVDTELKKKANTDGYYETMGVGTADNLTGQTERTDDAMYRKTGGSEEITSGEAIITNIKGNTVAWSQIAKPINSSPEVYGITREKRGNALHYSGTSTKSDIFIGATLTIRTIDTHKYYMSAKGIPNTCLINVSAFFKDSYVGSFNNYFFGVYIPAGVTINADVYFACVDLTIIYGAGNEPTTPEQFEEDYFKWFGKPLTYVPHDEGSLISVQLDSLKTTGFNQYNNGQARVIGALQYQITGTYTTITLNDETITPDANGLFTPSTTGTLIITGGGNDTCIHISGDRNGEYEPYEEHSVSLPVTTITGKLNGEGESVVVFPDGMKSAGTVYDEIYTVSDKTYAVKRVGSVDLGTQSYLNIGNTTFKFAIPTLKHGMNIVNAKYKTTSNRNEDKAVYGYDSYYGLHAICIRDSNYEGKTASEFKTAMNGVMLYYELATPQVYELDTFDLPKPYQVDGDGTEEQIQKSGVQGLAAILTCIYGVDAVKILDKLPQNYISEKSMDNFLAQLNTVTGGTWTKTWNENTGEWDFSFTPNAQTNDTNIEETI